MTRPESTAETAGSLKGASYAVLAVGIAGFVLGLILHVVILPGAEVLLFGSFAAFTFGSGLLAAAHRPRRHAETPPAHPHGD